jgi:hypothetical protein
MKIRVAKPTRGDFLHLLNLVAPLISVDYAQKIMDAIK